MNLNRFTERSQEALREAQGLATRANNQGVDVEHLMLALLAQRDGIAAPLLQAAGANAEQLRTRLQQELERLPKVTGPGRPPRSGLRHPAPEQAAHHGRGRGRRAEGRVRQRRAPAARRRSATAAPPAACCASRASRATR